MISHHRIFAVALLGSSVFAAPALAWNNFGHMEVAAVAWEKMSDPAKARAVELLKRNPDFERLVGDAPDDKADKYAFMRGATWPDMIKRMSVYHDDGTHGGDVPPDTPEARQNTGYTDKARHKYWHFVDKPFSDDGTQTQPEKDPNAQTQIPIMRTALGSVSDSDAAKDLASYDLVWLEHLVGDVHQPLHATTRFTQDLPDGDAGGNSVKVHCGTDHGCGASELHALWDDLLGPNTATPADVEAAANDLPDADATAAAIADEGTWIDESFQAAQSVVYQAPIGEGAGPFALTAEYGATAKALAKQRIALAGARLANMLNVALTQRSASNR